MRRARKPESRSPYNPFPLATLRATGLTARAKQVFTVLGAHCNVKGVTEVGFNRLCEETGRGREYVSLALRELEQKQRIFKRARGRKKRLSDATSVYCTRAELVAAGVKEHRLYDFDLYSVSRFPQNVSSAAEQTNEM